MDSVKAFPAFKMQQKTASNVNSVTSLKSSSVERGSPRANNSKSALLENKHLVAKKLDISLENLRHHKLHRQKLSEMSKDLSKTKTRGMFPDKHQ